MKIEDLVRKLVAERKARKEFEGQPASFSYHYLDGRVQMLKELIQLEKENNG